MLARNDLAQYIADNYGQCKWGSAKCICLMPKNPWLGCACPNWQPIEAGTWEELVKVMKGMQHDN